MNGKKAIALYLRLSMADGDLGKNNKDESNSIENQRLLLQGYIAEHFELDGDIREYVDDGYTGTNFDRPAFQRMIEDARKQKIYVVIVKDLSRLGREYIGVGDYIEQIFPVLGIRFIAVNNNFDSDTYGDTTMGLDLAVSNLINNLYSRDISKKCRSALRTRWEQGYATAGTVPFGYSWDKKRKGEWQLDPVASQYVRKIFEYALSGMNTSQISWRLNEEGIPTPGIYNLDNKQWGKSNFKAPESEQLWNAGMVWKILRRYEYTGALVMNRRQTLTLGSKTHRQLPESEHIVTEGAHAAIVTHEEFEEAQSAIRSSKAGTRKGRTEFPLKGKLVCGNCRRNLAYAEYAYGAVAYCIYKRKIGKHSSCCGANYSEGMINARVAYAIKQMLKIVGYLEDCQMEKTMMVEMPDVGKIEREMKQLKAERVRQYEAYADGVISREAYMEKKQGLNEKINLLQEELEKAEQLIEEERNNSEEVRELSEKGKEVGEGPLSKEMVEAFIEQVYVYDSNRVEVVFKCEDIIEAALDSIKEQEAVMG